MRLQPTDTRAMLTGLPHDIQNATAHLCCLHVLPLWWLDAEDDENKFVPVMAFECRGIEPTAFHPGK